MKASAGLMRNDRKLMMTICGGMLALIVVVSVLAPGRNQGDPTPSTYNTGPAGTKAAYLLLEAMGRTTQRWTQPLDELNSVDAEHTTLVLAEPHYPETDEKTFAAEVKAFLERGGRVVATGHGGALLLPEGAVKPGGMPEIAPGMSVGTKLCYTVPQGPGELARTGEVEIANHWKWTAEGTQFRVEQRCGNDAAVVRFAVGKGEAVWWSSSTPVSNAGLKKDGDLRLLLASVGDGRAVLFDEAMYGAGRSMWSAAKGLPLTWLSLQVALVMVLLVLSFSRRRGPVRPVLAMPRSSPVEFAESMGDLYEKARANVAATEAARRRLLRVLVREAGVTQGTVELGPEAIAEALEHRLGGDWKHVRDHLREVAWAKSSEIATRRALVLVRGLHEDVDQVRAALLPTAVRV